MFWLRVRAFLFVASTLTFITPIFPSADAVQEEIYQRYNPDSVATASLALAAIALLVFVDQLLGTVVGYAAVIVAQLVSEPTDPTL